ncbi:hypothetical protein T10_5653 [Trichinella papuae]|uniref:Uncharacterized protein n=1 Tax=Trichinella papuae TaxID=268474 RepID=A0A0V1MC91_9BILA|nr:hypothetical protein T10_5653 [Trichinella papuae]
MVPHNSQLDKEKASLKEQSICLLNVLKSSRSRTCLRENVCKFFYHCYTYACVASVFMVVGVRCAVRVEWRFSCDEVHRITTKTALLFIKSREEFCFFNVLKSSRSKTCLRENVCKFFFHSYTYACVASVSMVVGVRCAVRVEWRFSCDEIHRITTKTALLFKRECKIYIEATQASVSPNDVRRLSSYEQSLESRTSIYETDIIAQEE